MTDIISGKEIAQKLRDEIKKEILELKKKYGKVPGLAVIQVGDVAASSVYVRAKTKSAKEVGIEIIDHHLDKRISENELLEIINKLNNQNNVSGILVQLPLPKNINEQKILDSINPNKDADGFHPLNVGKLSISSNINDELLIPCTPLGCLIMLKSLKIDLRGKHAVVIGRSNIVGKPMAQLLIKESCTVTIAHSKTKNIEDECRRADIIIAAVGKPRIVKKNWVKKNVIVIDVGINRLENNTNGKIETKLVGDVDFEDVKEKCLAISPVPGGVGPMTINTLILNTLLAAQKEN